MYIIAKIFSLFLLVHLTYSSDNCTSEGKIHSSGTGTVLFNPTDVNKACWSQEEIAILTARIILEDVIPDPKLISVQCNEDVEDIVEYFKNVIDTIRSKTKARKRHILLLALTDLLGGFLHHALLPMARKAFYAGALDYTYMEKVIQLYEELKWFLRTNGQGWTKPMKITKEVKVPNIEMETLNTPKKDNESCCHKLMYYEHEPLKSKKRSVSIEKGIYFPLPFFDAKKRPTAIAVPLKHFAVRNVESKRAAYVIMKYFIAAQQCLKEKNAKPDVVQKFQNNLYTWIEKDVVPKLADDKFYAAFGGVLRVQNTLKILGAKIGSRLCNSDEPEEEVGAIPAVGCSSHRNKLLLVAMLVIIIAWFLIGTCFICYRMKNNKNMPPAADAKSSKDSETSSTYSSSKLSSSRSSSKTDKSRLCKCCESTLSEKTTPTYSSTSEQDFDKAKKRRNRSRNSAVLDTKQSVKVLPRINETNEQLYPQKDKNGSFRKISFADESGISSSDDVKVCAPPWAQKKNTIPCPILLGKNGSDNSVSKIASMNNKEAAAAPLTESLTQTKGEQKSSETKTDDIQKSDQAVQSTRNSKEEQFINELAESKPENVSDEYNQLPGPIQMTQSFNTQQMDDLDERKVASETSMKSSSTLNQVDNSPSAQFTTKSTTSEDPFFDIKQELKVKEEPADKEEQQGNVYYDYHSGACHSSMSGTYDLFRKPDPNKPYIFGYDFQTSTSSELSDDEDSKY